MENTTARRSGVVLATIVTLALLAVATTAATVSAKPTCDGRPATIVGTAKGEVIRGTPGRDVIVAGGGNDIVYGLGGRDMICGGPGNDTIYGGPGLDVLRGESGRDVISGGAGNDWLKGDAGADRLLGARGWDNVIGGPGPDTLYGGPGPDTLAGFDGNDRLFGGAGPDMLWGGGGTDRCAPGPGPGPHLTCEIVAPVPPRDLAIAWSDLDGDHRYGPGDVFISRLFDTNGDGIPSAGDTIFMGRYPIDIRMRGFADWGVDSHVVMGVDKNGWAFEEAWWPHDLPYSAHTIQVRTESGAHWWTEFWGSSYGEETRSDEGDAWLGSDIGEGHLGWDPTDRIRVDRRSPSQPETEVDRKAKRSPADKGFIDVDVYP
mgnify:FL=1